MSMKPRQPIQKILAEIDACLKDGLKIRSKHTSVYDYFEIEWAKRMRSLGPDTSKKLFGLYKNVEDINPKVLDEFPTELFALFIKDWRDRVEATLVTCFEDAEPLARFLDQRLGPVDRYEMPHLISKMVILSEIYRELEKQASFPLVYIDSSSLIRHFDKVCHFRPESNERAIVKFMFENHDFEELVDLDDVVTNISGIDPNSENVDGLKARVKRTIGDINRKTKEVFGFSIFKNPRGQIALTYKMNSQFSPKGSLDR